MGKKGQEVNFCVLALAGREQGAQLSWGTHAPYVPTEQVNTQVRTLNQVDQSVVGNMTTLDEGDQSECG